MNEIKMFEIRDEGTFIPAIAIWPRAETEGERWLWARSGYGSAVDDQSDYILLGRIAGGTGPLTCDPFGHGLGGRTMRVAHEYIIEHWATLVTGDVIDVQHILGEHDTPVASERLSERIPL